MSEDSKIDEFDEFLQLCVVVIRIQWKEGVLNWFITRRFYSVFGSDDVECDCILAKL